MSAPFITPMLCERLTDPARLADRRYIAEPKLDGQRAQLHVHERRAVACFSRRGLDLLRHPGMAWLREIAWPFDSAVFDGEACAGDGHEGIQSVFVERNGWAAIWRSTCLTCSTSMAGVRCGSHGGIGASDWKTWLMVASSLGSAWCQSAKTLQSSTKHGWGWAAGIVLKESRSLYRPGERSPAWLKLKPRLTLEMTITGGSTRRMTWGDWGEAVMLELAYTHPRSGAQVQIRQAVRVAWDQPFEVALGERASIICLGVMPSGMLRHPLFLSWA